MQAIEADISQEQGAGKFVEEALQKYLEEGLERLALINVASQFPGQEDFKRWTGTGKIEEGDWRYFSSNFVIMQNMTKRVLRGYKENSASNPNLRLDIVNFADERSQRYFIERTIHPFSNLGKKVIDITLEDAKTLGIDLLRQSKAAGRDFNPYLLSKLLIGYATRELALEYPGGNVRINAIAPGVMSPSPNDTMERAEEYAREATLTGRVEGHKIARDAILYLLEMTSNMTGNILFPDGGMHLLWMSRQTE